MMVGIKSLASLLPCLHCVIAQAPPPNITLPWGIWQAQKSLDTESIYVFNNVRFGAEPPRFGRSAPPTNKNSSIQDSSYGPSCIQIDPKKLETPPGGQPNLQKPLDDGPPQMEDCLFLDVYAPASNFDDSGKPIKELPVIVWFFGGAYAFGSKEVGGGLPLYTGQSMLAAQDEQAVFVAGNYRLGAFGWLAGSYMESTAQPNAALCDQALLLEWVQHYIAQAGGNPGQVSAWGESAGAGSILHHLIREGGTKDPLFHNFLVQSPAYEWAWDNSRDGTLDKNYKTFSNLSQCGYAYDIDCLRSQSVENLTMANQELFNNVKQTGLFPVGPSVDGQWIKTLPPISFSKKQYWSSIHHALNSHVYNEAASFTPSYVDSQETFDQFVETYFPEPDLAKVRDAVGQMYNCTAKFDGDFQRCVGTMIQESTFTCNNRQLFDAFPSISYVFRYSFLLDSLAVHASDIIPTFMNSDYEAYKMLVAHGIGPGKAGGYSILLGWLVKEKYQKYLSSFGIHGNPNTNKAEDAPEWPLATQGEEIGNVLELHDSWQLISDDQDKNLTCAFWTDIASQIEHISDGRSTKDVDQDSDRVEL